jgi:hypothetical protein
MIYTPIPLLLGKRDDRHGMRCILQDVVIPRLLSCYHFLCLTANVYHGIAKPFENRMRGHVVAASREVDSPINFL